MKKWLNVLLVSIMLMSATTMMASAQLTEPVSGYCGGEGDGTNLTWTLTTDGTLTIRGTGVMADYSLQFIDYSTQYDSPWFSNTDDIISVIIENGVTNISENAFADCNNLVSVRISNSVTSIGDCAFFECDNLADIIIPESVTSIGDSAFGWCCNLTNITIPNSVVSIGGHAFSYCTKLVSITIPDGMTRIDDLFYHCIRLTSVTIPESVTSIERYAFDYCEALQTIYYSGTEAQWNEITIEEYNNPLLNANIVFGSSGTEPDKNGNPFTDVPADAYYTEAVKWAYENGITTGTSETTFGPMETCTRGQVVTFLWRAKGCPEPTSTVNPFTDVKETDYFYKAVLWAVENGITNGMTDTTFGPKETCTSGHVVTFLWRANGQPAAVAESTLVESGKWYSDAVAWADSVGLLGGTGIAFAVSNNAPRADIVTYLYRDSAK